MKYYKQSRRKEVSHTKLKNGQPDWSYLAQELPSKTCYSGKDRGKNINDGKTKNKTKLLLG